MALKMPMGIEFAPLGSRQEGLAADETQAQQLSETALLVTFEVGADGIRIKEQRLTHRRRRPPLGQQDDCSEAIGFTYIQGRPMRGTPFGELAGVEAVVEHGARLHKSDAS